MRLNVYVPKPQTPAWFHIDRRSGIVGTPGKRCEPDHIEVDYEGNRFGAMNIVTWADRVHHAADRHTFNDGRGYPTVARMTTPAHDLTLVGTFNLGEPHGVELTDEAAQPGTPEREALLDWLAVDEEDLDPGELRTT